MKVTAKQANVLDNVHRIRQLRVGQVLIPSLDGQPCRIQINSLMAKGLMRRDQSGRLIKLAEPSGVIPDRRSRWARSDERQAGARPAPTP